MTIANDTLIMDDLIHDHLLLPEPMQRMVELTQGNVVLQSLYVVTKLGIADLLCAGPRHCDDLAKATQSNSDILYRILRFLTRFEVFTELPQNYFGLTPLSELLQNHSGSLRELVLYSGEEFYTAWGNFIQTLHTEKSAFQTTFRMNRCDYLAHHPAKENQFNAGTNVGSHLYIPALVAAYDFSTVHTLMDIGKGDRDYLPVILQQYPTVRGILLEKPSMVETMRQRLAAAGLVDRCEIVAGNYLNELPTGADGYLISNIHRMENSEAIQVMQNCRRTLVKEKIEHARLFIIERLVSDKLPWTILGEDLGLTVQTMGRLRSVDEFCTILVAGGFTLTKLVAVDATRGILEAKVID